LQKRVLLLPIIWGAYGLGEVFGLSYIFGPILSNIPYISNDKPIAGSYLPALFFNVTALLVMIAFSLYALGVWNIDLTNPKSQRDLGALIVMLISGVLIFTNALFLFPLVGSLVYFLATNID
jgi:predicted membrane channel-forming protein YqfA (hemolysin III family)